MSTKQVSGDLLHLAQMCVVGLSLDQDCAREPKLADDLLGG